MESADTWLLKTQGHLTLSLHMVWHYLCHQQWFFRNQIQPIGLSACNVLFWSALWLYCLIKNAGHLPFYQGSTTRKANKHIFLKKKHKKTLVHWLYIGTKYTIYTWNKVYNKTTYGRIIWSHWIARGWVSMKKNINIMSTWIGELVCRNTY